MTRCRKLLDKESSLFWVALQSNSLSDIDRVQNTFKKSLEDVKEHLKKDGWIFPTFQANMRNQINIANVEVEKGNSYYTEMQSSIVKLKSGSSLVGEIPTLFNVNKVNWKTKKDEILKHCIQMMSAKNDKNIVVLWDSPQFFKDVADDVERVVDDKNVVSYPSSQGQELNISNFKGFVEKSDQILVTRDHYFNGCEASNVILFTSSTKGVRNCLLRGVQNVICVQLTLNRPEYPDNPKIKGMKIDNRFL